MTDYTYNTGNPIGSTDVRDGVDNLKSFDTLMNSQDDTYQDRLGNTVPTAKGAIGRLGMAVQTWTSTDGGTLTDPAQTFLNNTTGSVGAGNYYAWTGAFPKVVAPGADPTAVAGFVMRSDVQWRENKVIKFKSVSEMVNNQTIEFVVGDRITTNSFHHDLIGVGGWEYIVVPSGTYNSTMPILREGVHWFTLHNGTQACMQWNFPIPIESMGVRNDGSSNTMPDGTERLTHAIAVGNITSGCGVFYHKGNLPTPTKLDLANFTMRITGSAMQEYSFSWVGIHSGKISIDLSGTDNNGKRIGFYLSHTDINSTDYTSVGGPWDSGNHTGIQRNITINNVFFFNHNWSGGGNNLAGDPPPTENGGLRGEWWSTSDENSIGVCINYAENVNLDGTISYGFTVPMWLYTWNSSWTRGRARNGKYGYVFPAGTTTSLSSPWGSGCNIPYHFGMPDFMGSESASVGIKPIGYTLISPAADGISDCAYNISSATSVSLIQPCNEGSVSTMIRIGSNATGNIVVSAPNFLNSNPAKYPNSSIVDYRATGSFCRFTLMNYKAYINYMPVSRGSVISVAESAIDNFLKTASLINVAVDTGVMLSNISDHLISKILLSNSSDFIRVSQSDNVNSFTINESDILSILSKYGTFSYSSNFFELCYEYATDSFQRYALSVKCVLQRTASGYQNITILSSDIKAFPLVGTGSATTPTSPTINVTYNSGVFTFAIGGISTPRRHSAVLKYIQSA